MSVGMWVGMLEKELDKLSVGMSADMKEKELD